MYTTKYIKNATKITMRCKKEPYKKEDRSVLSNVILNDFTELTFSISGGSEFQQLKRYDENKRVFADQGIWRK